jgi:hypothetical protein
MPYQLLETITFNGTATARGAAFDGFSQDGVNASPWWKRSGSGTAIADTPDAFKAYARKSSTALRHKIEWDFGPWVSGARYQPAFRQTGTLLSGDKYAAYSLFLSNAQFGIRANHDTALGSDVSLSPTVGDMHTLVADFSGNGTSTNITATLKNTTTGATLATSSVTGDTTAGLQGIGSYGWYGESSFVPAGWELREIRVYEWIADAAAPTISSGQIHPSGNVLSLTATDASLPLASATPDDLAGFTVEYRVVAGTGSWLTATVKKARIAGDSGEKIAFALASALPPTSEARVSYNAATGNIYDSSETPNALATFSNFGVTNGSATPTASSSEGVQILATRGFARTSASTTTSTSKEQATLTRHELPYGAADGWKVAFLGYSDGTSSSIVISGAAVWVKNPGEPMVRYPVTFSSSATATIAINTVQESDALPAVRPGAVVWSTNHAKPSSSSVNLPFTTFGYCRESATGLEDYDGVLSGATGAVSTACLLGGGFNHTSGATTETTLGIGGYAFRGYQPCAIVGQCHPSYTGYKTALGFIGDSINVQSNDYSEKVAGTLDPCATRGWNGRAASAANVPYVIFGQSGSVGTGFTGATGTAIFQYLFGTTSGDSGSPKRKVTHLVDEYGVNSLRDSAQATPTTYSDMNTVLWQKRVDEAAVAAQINTKYLMTTLTPVGASWIQGSMTIGQMTTERGQFNDQVRSSYSSISGCIGYWDLASAVETAQDNNTWVSAYNSDDIHPNSAGHDALATIPNFAVMRTFQNNVPGTPNFSDDEGLFTMVIDSSPTLSVGLTWSEATAAAGKTFKFGFQNDSQELLWLVAAGQPGDSAMGGKATGKRYFIPQTVNTGKKLYVRSAIGFAFSCVIHVSP